MNARRTSPSRRFRALYIAALAVALLGVFGAAFVPKAHAAPRSPDTTVAMGKRVVQAKRTDMGAIGALFGTGCASLAGLMLLASKH